MTLIFKPVPRQKNGDPWIPSNFFENPSRAWRLRVKTNSKEKEIIADPAQYDAVLRDPTTESVSIIWYGFLEDPAQNKAP